MQRYLAGRVVHAMPRAKRHRYAQYGTPLHKRPQNATPHHYAWPYDNDNCESFLRNEVKLSPEAARAINMRIHRGKDVLLAMTDQQITEDVYNYLPNEIISYRVTQEDLRLLFVVLNRDRQALLVKESQARALASHIKYVSGVEALLRQANKNAAPARIRMLALKLNLDLHLFTTITLIALNTKLDTLNLFDDDKSLIRKAHSLREIVPKRERTYNQIKVACHSSNPYFV
jgi:hypothetical protein